ncbi:MAG TPA: AMP-binding protein, partial [Miltoncostaea sp.]|nr:AMP-binding protein [Miltoncostaea sp.]
MPARFRRVASLHARRTAVDDGGAPVAYGELAARADGVAAALVARGVTLGAPVVLLLEQGVWNIVATLGVLLAGAAYAPLDPADPPAHLARLADLLAAPLVLADAATAGRAAALGSPAREVVLVDRIAPASAAPHVPVGPDALASVYFTSGTTGGAKGVMDSHANLLDNAARYTGTLRIGPQDRLSLVQSPAFSGAASSMFAALLNGATLVPIPVAGARLADVAAAIRTRRVTVYHSVPSLLRSIVAVDGGTFPDVRVVRLEGDRAAPADAVLHRRHFPAGSVLANGLGTTETGLCRQLRLRTGDPIPEGVLPVGGPVPGVEVAVVDDGGARLP